MALPASGAISLSQVNVELDLSATAQIGMNDAAVRTLFGVASGAISMSDGYGKANEFVLTISSNQTNANLSTLAVNAGWNGSSKLIATINSGIYCGSNSTGTPGLTVNGSFPNGVELINNGFIIGRGGNGGNGRNVSTSSGSGGSTGSAGGLALSVSSAISIRNNGTIGGGGGGGGGGRAGWDLGSNDGWACGGGGGGGGRSSVVANSSGGAGGSAATNRENKYLGPGGVGGSGTASSAGGGGAAGVAAGQSPTRISGAGGAGGNWGAAGAGGSGNLTFLVNAGGPFGGGAAGGAITGNSNITYLATGTRLGSIS